MPLSSYTLIHTDARLSEKEKKEIMDWIKQNIN
jgi:heme-binding protein